jgi:hypothetical protein
MGREMEGEESEMEGEERGAEGEGEGEDAHNACVTFSQRRNQTSLM